MLQANIDGISATPVAECTAARVAEALTRSFEGYVVPVDVSPQGYEYRFRPENVDPFASYVYLRETRPVAVVLVARRGWTSRVAAMAVAPEARGRGVGRRIMEGAIRETAARGDRSMLLEVFEHNTPAVNLYTGLGFKSSRRLVPRSFARARERRERLMFRSWSTTRKPPSRRSGNAAKVKTGSLSAGRFAAVKLCPCRRPYA